MFLQIEKMITISNMRGDFLMSNNKTQTQEKTKLSAEELQTLSQLKLMNKQAKKDTRAQVLMYVQNIEYLPFESVEALLTRIKSIKEETGIKRYALIVHDKDKKEGSDEVVEPHVHVVFEFNKRVVISAFAKKLNEKAEHFEIMTKRGTKVERAVENSMAYITHRTKYSSDKYQYPFDDVKANFNYKKFMDKIFERLRPRDIITQFSQGLFTRKKAERLLYKVDPYNIDRNFKRLDDIESAKGHLEYYDWKDKMQKNQQEKIVLWFYGEAGAGKTNAARYILSERYKEYFTSGGSRDVFEGYKDQHGILLDDVRPGFLNYSDMLKMLDPYEWEPKVSARYHNKQLQGEMYIITCPLDPYEFYREMRKKEKLSYNDKFEQLNRRITLTIHFDFSHITSEELNIGFDKSSSEIVKRIYKIKEFESPMAYGRCQLNELHDDTASLLKEYLKLSKCDRAHLVGGSKFDEERFKVGKNKLTSNETQEEGLSDSNESQDDVQRLENAEQSDEDLAEISEEFKDWF